jgi:hypothetical protein
MHVLSTPLFPLFTAIDLSTTTTSTSEHLFTASWTGRSQNPGCNLTSENDRGRRSPCTWNHWWGGVVPRVTVESDPQPHVAEFTRNENKKWA